MDYAESLGLPHILTTLQRFAAEPGADQSWQPAALLLRRAEAGTWQ